MPKKIILDCDPGHDDAVAIMLAAASKEIELLGGQITYEGILGKKHELAQWPFLFDVIHQIKNFNAN